MKKEFIKRYGWTLLGIVAGMVGGYLYWRYVGCTTGTCPITSSPVNSSIWGAAMGGLLLSSFMPEHRKIKKEESMNKTILFFLALVLAATTACGRGSSNNNPVKEETMATEGNGKVIHLTKAEFLAKVYNFEKNPEEWKYEGDKPAIVDFYADWCGPCKMVAPILDELAKEYDGQIVIYKVDTEKEQELAGAFGIRSIPSILFIPMEGKPEMAQGAMPKASFKKAIDEFLLKK